MLFSIITATYNSEHSIKTSLDSLNAQGLREFQHIVIDGASRDNTLELVKNIAVNPPALICEPDNGIYDALNKGLELSIGEYVGFLHSDDAYASSDTLSILEREIKNFKPDIIYGGLEYVRDHEHLKVVRRWRGSPFSPSKLKYGWMPPHPATFIKTSVYKELGGFDTTYKIAADFDSILRFFGNRDLSIRWIDDILVRMKLGGKSNKYENIVPKMIEDFKILRDHGHNPYVGLMLKNLRKLNQIRI